MKWKVLVLATLPMLGCSDMSNQPKQKTYRPLVGPAEIPSGATPFEVREQPAPEISIALLERGHERYTIYCAPCHGPSGDGKGMIVQRGFPPPPSYHIQRLRDAPPQHFFDVITKGFGAMYSYAERVPPADRWAIAAYIRALQRSQSAPQSSESHP